MRRPRPLLSAALGVLLVAALVFAIVASREGTHSTTSPVVSVPGETQSSPVRGGFEGAALPGARPAPGFTLTDQYGLTMSLASLRGEPVVLAFLYARCGGPCVLLAQQIRGALDELGAKPARVLIVSADPAGDTAPAVRAFLAQVSLSGRVHYLTGTETRLAAVWKAYGVHPAADGRAAFAKYATVRLLDSAGRERVIYGAEQLTPDALAHDVRKLQ
ncbi:MAG TPA: SCO family protein [Solirubrobacteraceae bacterium]|nr:SCO family protein [Solirubrobacteraceae bacterium]